MDVNQVVTNPKYFGLQQKIQFVYLSATNALTSMHLFAAVFLSARTNYECQSLTVKNETSPTSLHYNSGSLNGSLDGEGLSGVCFLMDQDTNNSVACNSFKYRSTEFTETTFTQFDLVCDRKSLATVSNAAFMAGYLVGAPVFGIVSDHFGRKFTIVLGILCTGMTAFPLAFAPKVEVFISLRFLEAFFCIGVQSASLISLIEMCPSKWRPLVPVFFSSGWCSGIMLLSAIAYMTRDWNNLQLTLACFSIPLMATCWWVVDETPLWLHSKNNHRRLLDVLKKIKNLNKLNDLDLSKLALSPSTKTSHGSKLNLPMVSRDSRSWSKVLRSRILLRNLCITSFLWFTLSMGYIGLALNVGNLVGNIYLNNFLSGAVEIPAYLILLASVKAGRKLPLIVMIITGGLCLIISAFLLMFWSNTGLNWTIIGISMTGKSMATSTFELAVLWSSEMYPTLMRNSMLGQNSVCARLGAITATVITDMPLYIDTRFSRGITPMALGIFMLIGGLLSIFLPETHRRSIPSTVEEANQMT